ncbi:MAG: non-homologous end-joining DNA ligase [Egibacteraceae bacterium]
METAPPQPVQTTVDLPTPLLATRDEDAWSVSIGGRTVRATNLSKLFWAEEGYTKADLLAYYANAAEWVLPYVVQRPLTLKRMPDGADGAFFYAKQRPPHTPGWIASAPVVSADSDKRIDYLLATDAASLVWLANLGCIELHPWHSRIDELSRPDYAFFDLDPFGVDFATVRHVALLVRTALDRLGLRSYPRTSGATGMQVYVPLDRLHGYAEVRAFVGRVCELLHRADPETTTMEFSIARRDGRVFLDHAMNTEGRNIAATYSLRPERGAPVATPLHWHEVEQEIAPGDFTIATIFDRLEHEGDLFAPVLRGGQDLREAMTALGLPRADERPAHTLAEEPGELGTYVAKRDFARTPEPPPADAADAAVPGSRFVIQHHLATRLHHDLRLERGGTARSWALPKGLPELPGVRHLAVPTEDHPLEYMTFEGQIPEGEYGAGPVRIWDAGTYETLEWQTDKVTFRLHGRRHAGTWHLFATGEGQWLVTRRDRPAVVVSDPPALTPMLATAVDEPFDDDAWRFEVKWDGVRALATVRRPGAGDDGQTRLISRNGNDLSSAYPELAGLWERVLARNAVLDGELVALDATGRPSFQALQRRMHLREPQAVQRAARRDPVRYVVFDLLALDGEALVDRTLSDRLDLLADVLIEGGPVLRSQGVTGSGRDYFQAAQQAELEGIMAKRLASPYRPGRRSRDWLKLKVRRRALCVVGGCTTGEGSLTNRLASLLIGLYDDGALRWVGRVGTGFDEAERTRLEARLAPLATPTSPFVDGPDVGRWTRPELVCEVAYAELTDAGRLRAPSYLGEPVDADPRACLLADVSGGQDSAGMRRDKQP